MHAPIRHPARSQPPRDANANESDYLLTYPIHEKQPLHGMLYVQPWGVYVPPPTWRSMDTASMVLSFGFRGLTRTPDFLLRLLLGHGRDGVWPKDPGILVEVPRTKK